MADIHVEALDQKSGVYRVMIDRKPVNALSFATYQELRAAFDAISDDAGARCIVLTSAGERAFVSGSDVHDFAALSPANAPSHARIVRGAFQRDKGLSRPGHRSDQWCGPGSRDRARIRMRHPCGVRPRRVRPAGNQCRRAGRSASSGASGPPMIMRRMALTGHRISATQMHAYGALAAVVPFGQLAETALQLAQEIAAKSPPAVRLQKETLNVIENLALKDGYQVEQMATGLLSGTAESKAAVEQFFNKAARAANC